MSRCTSSTRVSLRSRSCSSASRTCRSTRTLGRTLTSSSCWSSAGTAPKYFLSEELLEGAPIRLVLDENPWEPLTYDEVLAVLRGVGDALNYAHAKGIVHGDLGPRTYS